MSNEEKLRALFAKQLRIDEQLVTDTLAYNSIKEWSSLAHMSLVASIEESFNVMMDTNDVGAKWSPDVYTSLF